MGSRVAEMEPERPLQLVWGFVPIGARTRARRAAARRPPGAHPAARTVAQTKLDFEAVAPALAPRTVLISGNARISLSFRMVVPIRPAALRAFVPRRDLPGARPKSMGTKPLAVRTSNQVRADLRELAREGYYIENADGQFVPGSLYPQVYGDCEDLVPRVLEDGSRGWCPFIGCRNHLGYEVDPVTGALKEMFPGRELWELEHTCVLRFIEEAPDEGELADPEMTLKAAGRVMNLTTESVRLTAMSGLAKVKRRLPAVLRTEEDDE